MFENAKKLRNDYDPLPLHQDESDWYENAIKKDELTVSELSPAQLRLLALIDAFHAEELPTIGNGEPIPGEERYELGEVAIPVTAHAKIQGTLAKLLERMRTPPDINNLSATEWCLREILTQADRAISSGRCTINLLNLSEYMVASLEDEGVEKWENGFEAAAIEALDMFRTQSNIY